MKRDGVRVPLSEQLTEQCERRIQGTEFDSVEEYVQFIVREVVEGDDREGVSEDATDELKRRLEALGYR